MSYFICGFHGLSHITGQRVWLSGPSGVSGFDGDPISLAFENIYHLDILPYISRYLNTWCQSVFHGGNYGNKCMILMHWELLKIHLSRHQLLKCASWALFEEKVKNCVLQSWYVVKEMLERQDTKDCIPDLSGFISPSYCNGILQCSKCETNFML